MKKNGKVKCSPKGGSSKGLRNKRKAKKRKELDELERKNMMRRDVILANYDKDSYKD